MEWVNRLGMSLEFLAFWFAAPEILGEERLRALEQRVEEGIKVLPSVLMILLVVGGVGVVLQWAGELAGVLTAPLEKTSTLGWARWGVGFMLAVTFWLNYSFHHALTCSKAEAGKWTKWRLLTAPAMLWFFSWISIVAASVILLGWVAWAAKAWMWVVGALLAALVLALEIALGVRQPSGALIWAATGVVATGLMMALMGEATRTWGGASLLAEAMAMLWLGVYRKVAPPLLRRLAEDEHIRQRSLFIGAVLFVVGFLLQLIATF